MQKCTCPICGTEISVHQSFQPGHCGAADCARRTAVAAQIQRQSEKKARYQEDVDAARHERAADLDALSDHLSLPPEQLAVGVVPHRATPLVPLAEADRSAYLRHLAQIIKAAFDTREPQPEHTRDQASETEEPYPWNTLACTACEGHCCVQGGGDAFAFQRTDLIQHLRIRHPDLGPGAMQSHFEAALPDQHIKGACLFQGPQGCTLTRDWRADICNTFRCFELEQLARQVDTSKHKALAIFSMHDRSPRRMTAYATKDTSGGDG